AEDGIRDRNVTGVQTCALPILQTGQSMSYDAVFNGYPQLAGVYPPSGATFAPQMIQLEYVSGMLPRKKAGRNKPWEMPPELEQLVIKYALKEIYQVWGNLIIGRSEERRVGRENK